MYRFSKKFIHLELYFFEFLILFISLKISGKLWFSDVFRRIQMGTLGWRKILFNYKNQLVFRYLHLEHYKKFVVSSCQHLAQSLPKKSLEKSLQFPWDAELVSTISFIYLFLNSFIYLFIFSWQITSVSIHKNSV